MGVRFVHTADIHLGKSFTGLPAERARQRREDLLQVLRSIVRVCREQQADLLLICGDLFDQESPPQRLVEAVSQILHPNSFAPVSTQVIIVPGNHDPSHADSPYRCIQFPPNVHVFTEPDWKILELKELPVLLYGIAYDYARPQRNVIAELSKLSEKIRSKGLPAIALAHASPDLAEFDQEKYHPFQLQDLSGLTVSVSYLALGHWHRHRQLSAKPLTYFCGSPEPLSEREGDDVHLVVLGEVDEKGGVSVQFRAVNVRYYRNEECDVGRFSSEAELVERFLSRADGRCLLSLHVQGVAPPESSWDAQRIEEELAPHFFNAHVELSLHLPATLHATPGTVKAEFIRQMQEEKSQTLPEGRWREEVEELAHQAGVESAGGLANFIARSEVLEWALRYGVLALEDKEL